MVLNARPRLKAHGVTDSARWCSGVYTSAGFQGLPISGGTTFSGKSAQHFEMSRLGGQHDSKQRNKFPVQKREMESQDLPKYILSQSFAAVSHTTEEFYFL
jgi:hypothetical protein